MSRGLSEVMRRGNLSSMQKSIQIVFAFDIIYSTGLEALRKVLCQEREVLYGVHADPVRI